MHDPTMSSRTTRFASFSPAGELRNRSRLRAMRADDIEMTPTMNDAYHKAIGQPCGPGSSGPIDHEKLSMKAGTARAVARTPDQRAATVRPSGGRAFIGRAEVRSGRSGTASSCLPAIAFSRSCGHCTPLTSVAVQCAERKRPDVRVSSSPTVGLRARNVIRGSRRWPLSPARRPRPVPANGIERRSGPSKRAADEQHRPNGRQAHGCQNVCRCDLIDQPEDGRCGELGDGEPCEHRHGS